jgi:hypothetical protein
MIVWIRDDYNKDDSISDIDNDDNEDVCKLLCIVSTLILDLYLINTSLFF